MRQLYNRLVFMRRYGSPLMLPRIWWQSLNGTFNAVEAYCTFIGYPRSGHTLMMAMLDAHPEIMLGNEADVFGAILLGFKRPYIQTLLIESSRQFVQNGAMWQGYPYVIEGQWQGTYQQLRVLGNKNGGVDSRYLHGHPELLDQLRTMMSSPIRIIHVIRNPYDNISTISRKGENIGDLEQAIDRYFLFCDVNQRVIKQSAPDEVLNLWHEDMISDPATQLTRMCQFLSVDVSPDYVDACVSLVYESPNKSRHQVDWHQEQLERIQAQMNLYPFLDRYTFDS